MKAIFRVDKTGLAGSLIRLFERRGISHCEIQFSDGYSGSAIPGAGVVLRPLVVNPADWFVIDIPCSLELESVVRQFFYDEAGCGYDWWGIVFANVLGWNWSAKNKWTCSEACTVALRPVIPGLRAVAAPCVDPATLAGLLEVSPEVRGIPPRPIG